MLAARCESASLLRTALRLPALSAGVRSLHHNPHDKPPVARNAKVYKQFKKALELKSPNGHAKAVGMFQRAARADARCNQRGVDYVDATTPMHAMCGLMLDNCFSKDAQADVVAMMAKNGIEHSSHSYASLINWLEVENDTAATQEYWDAIKQAPIELTPRLTRLVDMAPEKVARERAHVMRRGNEFGKKAAVRALFYKLKEDNLAHAPHYFAMMWAFDSYDDQVGFLMNELVPGGGGKGWEMNPEVFNAQLWQLMLEDRYDDMHQLVEVIKKKQVRLDDRSFYVLKRAGQRMRKQRRAQIDERFSWEPEQGLDATVRSRVGL